MVRYWGRSLAEDEVLAVDAGVKVGDLQEAGIVRYVIRRILPLGY